MGYGHPDLMRDALTVRQVSECWNAYAQEPWGELREDYRFAHLIQQMAMMQPGAKNAKAPDIEKIRLRFVTKEKAKPLAQIRREQKQEKADIEAKTKLFKKQAAEVLERQKANKK